jgi:hypothetical protein
MQPFQARPEDVSVKSGHVIAGFEHVAHVLQRRAGSERSQSFAS